MKFFRILCAALLIIGMHRGALAQSYPDKPIRLIVPYPAGESVDVIARLITQRWSPLLGQPIIVDNRVGAGGLIGTAMAAKATADGYVLLMGNVGTLAITPSLRTNPPYDVLKDFAPVSQVAHVPFFLFVSPAALPVTSVKREAPRSRHRRDRACYRSARRADLCRNRHAGAPCVFMARSGCPRRGSGRAHAAALSDACNRDDR